ncbi:hypothetical protein TRIP_B250136 [uncultured Desulfatiglans sp.]|nr:hypothetical protein TRIP_B250136 [uncultured Desulfatiglans sp.]
MLPIPSGDETGFFLSGSCLSGTKERSEKRFDRGLKKPEDGTGCLIGRQGRVFGMAAAADPGNNGGAGP